MILSIIVAYAKDNKGRFVIGKNNSIPWNLPKDLIRFREYTTGNAVVMGRKTFESIGKPLRRRENIIITKQENYEVPNAYVFNDLDKALKFVGNRYSEVFIIGGQELYEQTINKIDRLYITHIDLDNIKGDTFFPKWERSLFKTIYQEIINSKVEFEILQRIKREKQTISNNSHIESLEGMSFYWPWSGFGI